jgi:hypothetical protein
MKKSTTTLLLAIALVIMAYAGRKELMYCDGWRKGYEDGWCFRDVNCMKPVTPVCPIPEINLNTYQDAYNRGFVKGKKDRKCN